MLPESAWQEYLDQFQSLNTSRELATGVKSRQTSLSNSNSNGSATSTPCQINCEIQHANVIPQRLRSQRKTQPKCNWAEDDEEEIIFKTNTIARNLNFQFDLVANANISASDKTSKNLTTNIAVDHSRSGDQSTTSLNKAFTQPLSPLSDQPSAGFNCFLEDGKVNDSVMDGWLTSTAKRSIHKGNRL